MGEPTDSGPVTPSSTYSPLMARGHELLSVPFRPGELATTVDDPQVDRGPADPPGIEAAALTGVERA
jgi:hypothetical protein